MRIFFICCLISHFYLYIYQQSPQKISTLASFKTFVNDIYAQEVKLQLLQSVIVQTFFQWQK